MRKVEGRELQPDEYRPGDGSDDIGYGQRPEDRGYDAHVVTVVVRRWLLDLTLGGPSPGGREAACARALSRRGSTPAVRCGCCLQATATSRAASDGERAARHR